VLEHQSLVTCIAVGAIAGWLASLLVEGYGLGLLGNIIVGAMGALVAYLAVWALGLHIETTLGNIIAATAGSVGVLLLAEAVRYLPRIGR